jgi:hypothetical protein
LNNPTGNLSRLYELQKSKNYNGKNKPFQVRRNNAETTAKAAKRPPPAKSASKLAGGHRGKSPFSRENFPQIIGIKPTNSTQ